MNKNKNIPSKPFSRTGSSPKWVLYFLILLSGAAGLVYEVVWARQLTLFIGNTAISNAAVLTAFMIGLAAGSLVLGRKADTIAKPLRLYALIEILIGCYGAITPWLFDFLQVGYANFAGVTGVIGPYSHLPRFLIAIVAMLIPTFLMGGTLPLLVRHFTQRLPQAHSVTSRIYGINTLGATLGAFSAGFLLLPALGITNTLLAAALINIAVGLGVYQLLAMRGLQLKSTSEGQTGSEVDQELQSQEQIKDIARPGLLLIGFALSGFAALLYQVIWIHSLVLVIGVSVYGFSTVLTVFLGGVGLGSLLIGRFVPYRNAQHSLKIAFYLQLGIALMAVVSLSLISQLPILFVSGWAKLHESFVLFQAYTFLLAAIAMLIPTILLGALFPLITGVWSNTKGTVGRGVGEAYGANALGTIAGSAIGGLFILDWLGIEYSLYLASAVSMVVAALFWYLSSPGESVLYRYRQIPVTALLLVVTIDVMPGWDRDMLQSQVFRRSDRYLGGDVRSEIRRYFRNSSFLYYKEGIHGTVSVYSRVRNGLRTRALVNNGKVDASTGADMMTQVLLGQLPMLLHADPREVMVIGLGSGVTAGSVLQNKSVENVDLLEISPEIVEASTYFRDVNYDVLENPRTNLIVADARNYLLASDKKYDVIISEPSHSWVTGVSNLFTLEFLQQAKKRLKKDGILTQWYHLYGIDRESLSALLKSVSDVFENYTLWYLGGGDIIIVSSSEPLELDYQDKLSFFDSPQIKSDLSRVDIHSLEQLMNNILMSSAETSQLLLGKQANTDDLPIVEFNGPKFIYKFTTQDNVRMLFGELEQGEYTLPMTNLATKYSNTVVVPFMGVRIFHEGDEFSEPTWKAIRTSVYKQAGDDHRLLRGMNGEIVVHKSWGDLFVRSTMAQRNVPEKGILLDMLEFDIPADKQTFGGELQAEDAVVYWRAGPSPQTGSLHVSLARLCERESEFDNMISFSTHYAGDAAEQSDVSVALKKLGPLVRCL